MKHEFDCSQCKKHIVYESDFTTGYGQDAAGAKFCYACIGENDAKQLKELKPKERTILYFDTKEKTLSNWPGSLKITVGYIRTGRHNFAGKRYDTWFKYGGNNYHAVQYGDNTQIAHVTRLRA